MGTLEGTRVGRSWARRVVLGALATAVATLTLGGLVPVPSGLGVGNPPGAGAATIPGSSTDTTFPAGSLIVDLGKVTGNATEQTKAEALKPYGFVFELLVDRKIPVSWIIADGKTAGNPPATGKSDTVDFSTSVVPNGSGGPVTKDYKGSAFVVSQRYLSDLPPAILTTWRNQGVVIDVAESAFVAPEFTVLKSWPKAVLDAQNGALAIPYYQNAGIPASLTPAVPAGAGVFESWAFKSPDELNPCDDIYVMPHADPTWATHQNLLAFNNAGGAIWAGCHAISVLESLDGNNDGSPDMNFLSTNGLLDYGSHSDGSTPYAYNTDGSDPILQFLGVLDAATTNGSEQIFMPKPGSAWRPTTKVLAWDPTQADVPGNSPGEAAVLAYGRGFGQASNGVVMYEAGHSLNGNNTGAAAAQRAFLNEHLLAGYERAPDLQVDVPANAASGTQVTVEASITGGSAPYDYQWESSCGGTFGSASGTRNAEGAFTTTFTAPAVVSPSDCNIRLLVTDSCGRGTFGIDQLQITPPEAPVARNDGFDTPFQTDLSATVVANDTYAPGSTFAVTTPPPGADGSLTLDPDGSFVFSPASAFTGTTTFDYEVCLAAPYDSLCDPAQVTIVVGPDALDDSYATDFETNLSDTVVDNDTSVPGSTFAVTTAPPGADGSLTFDPDGSFVFAPAAGFTGSTTFDYEVCLPAPNATMCDPATATIAVGPVARNDSFETPFETDLWETVVVNDTSPPGSTFGLISPPPATDGTVSDAADGSFVFSPAPGFSGTTTFDYQVCLAVPFETVCDAAQVTVVVGPGALDDSYTTSFDTNVSDTVANNDTSPPGSTFAVTTPPPGTDGTLTLDPDGSFVFSPASGFTGTTTFEYELCLAAPNDTVCDPATATITVGPKAIDDTYDLPPASGSVSGDLGPNDQYPVNATFTMVTPPANGALQLDPSGTFTYVPNPGFTGTDAFTYDVCFPVPPGDPGLPADLCSQAVASLQVTPTADLGVTKSHVGPLMAGSMVTYTIDATNDGPSNVTGARVVDELPADLVDAAWTCDAAGGAVCPAAWGIGAPDLTVDIPNGGSVHLTLTATVQGGSGDVVNTVRITPPAGVVDPNPANDVAIDGAPIEGAPASVLAMTGSSTRVWAGLGVALLGLGLALSMIARRARRRTA